MTSSLPPLPSRKPNKANNRKKNKNSKQKKRSFKSMLMGFLVIVLMISIGYVGSMILNLNHQIKQADQQPVNTTQGNTDSSQNDNQNSSTTNGDSQSDSSDSSQSGTTSTSDQNTSTSSGDPSTSDQSSSSPDSSQSTSSGESNTSSSSDTESGATAPIKLNPDAYAMVILGLDTSSKTKTHNTDVVMVAAFNPDTKKVEVVSLPRDTYIHVSGQPDYKVNAIYSKMLSKNKETAFTETKRIFSKFLNIPIQYMFVTDFQGFEKGVDQLGGIQVDVMEDMCYTDHFGDTSINLKKGKQTLNGDQALDYVRYIRSNCGTHSSNDFQRNVREQQALKAIMNKIVSLKGMFHLPQLIQTVGKYTSIDMPYTKIAATLKLYTDADSNHLHYVHLDGDWKSPYVYADQKQLNETRQSLVNVMK